MMKLIKRLSVIEIVEDINTIKLIMLPRSDVHLIPEGIPQRYIYKYIRIIKLNKY